VLVQGLNPTRQRRPRYNIPGITEEIFRKAAVGLLSGKIANGCAIRRSNPRWCAAAARRFSQTALCFGSKRHRRSKTRSKPDFHVHNLTIKVKALHPTEYMKDSRTRFDTLSWQLGISQSTNTELCLRYHTQSQVPPAQSRNPIATTNASTPTLNALFPFNGAIGSACLYFSSSVHSLCSSVPTQVPFLSRAKYFTYSLCGISTISASS
jgi:hypothetical protein